MSSVNTTALTLRQVRRELSGDGMPLSDETVRRWHSACPYLDGQPFAPVNGIYPRDDFARLAARRKAVAEGSWQGEDGIRWLCELKADALLRTQGKARRVRQLRVRRVSRNALRRLERIWDRKGAQLLPDAPDLSLSLCRYGCKWYAEPALAALRTWLNMEPGRYGTAAEPTLDLRRAAAHVGCDKGSILNFVGQGLLKPVSDYSRNHGRQILTFKVADLDVIKRQRAAFLPDEGQFTNGDGSTSRTLKAASAKYGIPLGRLHRLVKKTAEADGTSGLDPAAVSRRDLPTGGKRSYAIRDGDLVAWQKKTARELRQGVPAGYADEGGLARELGLGTTSERIELTNCLSCWRETQGLKPKECLTQVDTKAKRRSGLKQYTQLVRRKVYEVAAVRRLWDVTCSVEAGAKLLRQLVPAGQTPTVQDVRGAMYAAGFAGLRHYRCLRKAGVVARPRPGNAAVRPWVYTRGGRDKDAEAVLRGILAAGPIRVQKGKSLAREAGLRRGGLEKALKSLGVRSRRETFGGGPWYWLLPGQRAPKDEPRSQAPPSQSHPAPVNGISPTTEEQAPRQKRGRPRSEETKAVYKFCNETRQRVSDPVVMRQANTQFKRRVIRDVKQVWLYAKRHADRNGLPMR